MPHPPDMLMATAEATSPTNLRDHRWRWRDLVIGVTPILLLDMVAATYGGGIRNSFPAWTWIAIDVLQATWMLAWPLWAARPLAPPPKLRRLVVETGWAMLALPVVMVAQFALQAILPRLIGSQDSNHPLDPTFRASESYHRTALAVLAIGVAPFAEETFFRGMLYNALRQRVPFVLAALVTGMAFGMMHPYGRSEQVTIAIKGFLLAVLYEWRKTLATPILVHGMVNALGMAMLFYSAANSPVLGVRGEAAETGCVLTEVIPGGSAAEAGLQVGDVVIHAGQNSVRNLKDLAWILRTKRIGDKLPIWYNRGDEEGYVEVVLKGRPTP